MGYTANELMIFDAVISEISKLFSKKESNDWNSAVISCRRAITALKANVSDNNVTAELHKLCEKRCIGDVAKAYEEIAELFLMEQQRQYQKGCQDTKDRIKKDIDEWYDFWEGEKTIRYDRLIECVEGKTG